MVEGGDMPLPNYLIMHSNAKLDPTRIKVLKDWVNVNGDSEGNLRYQHNHNDD